VNVIFVIPYFYPAWQYGGQPRSAYELARALVSRGHTVKVLTTDSGGTQRLAPSDTGRDGHQTIEGVDIIYYRNFSNTLAYRHRIFWPPAMFREIDQEMRGGDLVHIHELRSTLSISAYGAVKRLGIPFVLSAHGGLRRLGRMKLKVVYDSLWGRRILKDAAAIIAISPVEERDALTMLADRARLRRLPNAISVSEYALLPQRGEFRRRWRIPACNVVLFLGRLHWIKGADILLTAFSKVASVFNDVHLVLAGPDEGQGRELHRLATQFRIQDRVTFTGHLDNNAKLEAFMDAAIVAVPSRSEVFAISAVEALMCSRPVLMSSACGLFPLPEPEHGVVVFHTEDVDDLAKKLSMMLSDTVFERHAASGKAFVVSEFGSGKIAQQAEDIYSDVLQFADAASHARV
jgi:glycosyltransferase involved in cell wall biosynthesis